MGIYEKLKSQPLSHYPLYIDCAQLNDNRCIIDDLIAVHFYNKEIAEVNKNQLFLFIFDNFHLGNELNNIFIKYQLGLWQAKIIVSCSAAVLHSSLDPSLYFAPIRKNKILKNLLYTIVLPANLVKPLLAISLPVQPITIQPETVSSNFLTNHFLNQKLLTTDTLMMQLLADKIREHKQFKDFLFILVHASRENKSLQVAAANAITALNYANVAFTNMNLQGIRVPYADLSYAVLDHTNLQDADLTGVILQQAWLHGTHLEKAIMTNVVFGEYPFLAQESSVYALAYSPCGKWLAVASGPCVYLWQAENIELIHILEGHTGQVHSLVFSNNSDLVFSAGRFIDNKVCVWDVISGQLMHVFKRDTNSVRSLSLNLSRLILALGDFCYYPKPEEDYTIWLWDVQKNFCLAKLAGHQGDIKILSFSHDGKLLASSGNDKTVRVWDIESYESIFMLTLDNNVNCLAFAANSLLAVVSQQTIQIWQLAKKYCIQTLYDNNTIDCITFDLNQTKLATGNRDETVKIWDLTNGQVLQMFQGSSGQITCLAFSPTQTLLASGNMDTKVRIWALSRSFSHLFDRHTGYVNSLCFTSDGNHLITGSSDKTIRIWHTSDGQNLQLLQAHKDQVNSIALSTDANVLASGSSDKTIKLWDITTGKLLETLFSHDGDINCVSLSQNGSLLAFCSLNKIAIWDIVNCSYQISIECPSKINVITFINNKTLASGGFTKTVQLWDLVTAQCIKVLQGYTDVINCLTLHPNQQFLASAGYEDKSVRIWPLISEKVSSVILEHKGRVCSVVFSPDGQFVASGTVWSTLRIWDWQKNICILILPGYLGGITSIAWHKNGMLATGSYDYSIKCWYVSTDKNNQLTAKLIWRTLRCLFAEDCQFQQAINLSLPQQKLFNQAKSSNEQQLVPLDDVKTLRQRLYIQQASLLKDVKITWDKAAPSINNLSEFPQSFVTQFNAKKDNLLLLSSSEYINPNSHEKNKFEP